MREYLLLRKDRLGAKKAVLSEMELNYALTQTGDRLGWSLKRKPKPKNQEGTGECVWCFHGLCKHLDHYLGVFTPHHRG